MIDAPPCPICRGFSWEEIGQQTFSRSTRRLSAYVRKRYEVLFGLWFADREKVTIRFVLCRDCGFVIYTPRPEGTDLDAKYRALGGSSSGVPIGTQATRTERNRSREICDAVLPYLESSTGRILDFGGGRGALLSEFAERGYECNVLDYTPHSVPGVQKLGDSLPDLSPTDEFSLVVSSHVLEHLADPVDSLSRLRRHMADRSILFAEVPLEILGGRPHPREPVTHINYFSEGSVRSLLETAGYRVLKCWTQACLFSTGRFRYGIRAIAQPAGAPRPASFGPNTDRTRAVLKATLPVRAMLALRNPRVLLGPLAARITPGDLLSHARRRTP